jgi:hypothetical protein
MDLKEQPLECLPHFAPRFDLEDAKNISNFLEYLEVHGYAVISGVAQSNEITQAKEDFWNFCSDLCPDIKRNEPDSWVKIDKFTYNGKFVCLVLPPESGVAT